MQAPLQARNDADAAKTDTAKTVAQKRVLADNWPEAVAQRKLAEMMNTSPRVLQQRALSDAIYNSPRMVAQHHEMNALFGGAVKPQGDGAMPAEASLAQREEKTNKTGLPNQLKSGIESLSGMSMDHVKVHYNSDKPAQLQAHAYAQGNEIHLGPGQETHLPHEAWHVVQQAQGRVRPTLQLNASAVNDDLSLEKEADMMGEKAAQFKGDHDARNLVAEERVSGAVTQRVAGFDHTRNRTGVVVQKADIRDATVVDAAAPIPAIGSFDSAHLNNMSGGWGNGTQTENTNKLAFVIGLPSINGIVTDLRRSAAQTGANADDMNITYDHALGDHGVAKTKVHGQDWTEINISIGPSAFASGSLLYSTIRHELIHAAQHRRTDAKEQNWNGDIDGLSTSTNTEFNLGSYEPYEQAANMPAVHVQRNEYYQKMNVAISEMEAHRWEYQNADFTGHNSAADSKGRGEFWIYFADAWNTLATAADKLKKSPNPAGGQLSLHRYNEYAAHANALLPTQQDRDDIAAL
jgi:hypothetical protein